jgi:neutral ceramidase
MRTTVWFLIFLTVSRTAIAAGPVVLRAGVGREDITPAPAVLNWVTGKPYGTVRDPLFVQALVLDDGRQKAALIRWDLVDVGESARDAVRAAVGSALQIPPDNILVHASHNHSAPWVPVYGDNHRGKERETWWAIRYMPSQTTQPEFKAWMTRLVAASVQAAQRAAETAQPITLSVARVAVGEYLFNRRPRPAPWGVVESKKPPLRETSPDWNPEVLSAGATFGPMDRTMTLLLLRDARGAAVATLFHVACHAVAIYPSDKALSADWPGAAREKISGVIGGEALFLQGCAGDMNPWRRGAAAVDEMAAGLARKAQLAVRQSGELTTGPLLCVRTTVMLPLTDEAKARLGADSVAAEIQAIVCGPLAFVALPGEPMTEIGMAIRARSPFPQTLVLGYSNGNGVHYVGMPGEKARGGYEAGVAGAGTDACGPMLVEAAAGLLEKIFAANPPLQRSHPAGETPAK